jgi:hypothetical protein
LARRGAALRAALALAHWGALGASWKRLGKLVAGVGAGADGPPPATFVALSGDVHHAYLAEVGFPNGANVRSRVYQAVCSPFRNPLDTRERRVIKAVTSRPAAAAPRRARS